MYGLLGACWHTKRDASKHTKRNATGYAGTRHAFEKITDTRYADKIDLRIRTSSESSNHANPAILQLDASTRHAPEKIANTRYADEIDINVRTALESNDSADSAALWLDAVTRYTFAKFTDASYDETHIHIRSASKSINHTNAEVLKLGASHFQTRDGQKDDRPACSSQRRRRIRHGRAWRRRRSRRRP